MYGKIILHTQSCFLSKLGFPLVQVRTGAHYPGSYKGIHVMRNQKLILFSAKRELRKVFFVILDLKVLRDPRRT